MKLNKEVVAGVGGSIIFGVFHEVAYRLGALVAGELTLACAGLSLMVALGIRYRLVVRIEKR